MRSFIITNSRIILPGRIETGKTVVVENGVIKTVTGDKDELSTYRSFPEIDGDNKYLAPGLTEMHIHGCGDVSVDAAIGDASILPRMKKELARNGVNTFVPTLMCNPPLISALAEQMKADPGLKDSVPGLYIEGPFVSPEKRGGILPDYLHESSRLYLEEILTLGEGFVKVMTLAPELEGIAGVVNELDRQGIIVGFGHSRCTFSEAQRFVSDSSRRTITHLFNAMSGFSHKEAGLAMIPFLDNRVFTELNGDGIHVNNETVRLCAACLNPKKLILISDAVVSAGRPYGTSVYYGKEVVSGARGVRYLDDDILIGSNLLVPQVLKRFVKLTGTAVENALPMVTLNPCKLLGIDGRRGSIEAGKDADLILLDDDLNLVRNLFTPG